MLTLIQIYEEFVKKHTNITILSSQKTTKWIRAIVFNYLLSYYVLFRYLGFYNKCIDWSSLKHNLLLLIVVETGQPQIRTSADSVSGLLPGSYTAVLSLSPHLVDRGWKGSLRSLRALIPLVKVSPSWLYHFQ